MITMREMMLVMHIGGVTVASDATFPAQLVGWPDLAGLAYLSASTASTPKSWLAIEISWVNMIRVRGASAMLACGCLFSPHGGAAQLKEVPPRAKHICNYAHHPVSPTFFYPLSTLANNNNNNKAKHKQLCTPTTLFGKSQSTYNTFWLAFLPIIIIKREQVPLEGKTDHDR